MSTGWRVSVIVPTFNRAHMLPESIRTLVEQTCPPLEVIVVDDGSSDNTSAVVAALPGPVRYVRQDNAGKASAVNRGLQEAQGDLIWLFDDDDWAQPDAIERRLQLLAANPSLGFVGGGHRLGHAGVRGEMVVESRRHMPAYPVGLRRQKLFEDCYFSLCSVLAHRRCFDAVSGLDVSLKSSEDYDALIRMAALFEFDVIDDVIFTVRQHGGVRGAGEHAYEAAKRREVFRRSDRVVGLKMRAELPLSLFEPSDLVGGADSSAWLERAVVMASKGLLGEAFSDLSAHLDQAGRLGAGERKRVMDMMWCDYACDAALDDLPSFVSQLGDIAGKARMGRRILWLIRLATWRRARMRGLPWAKRRPLLRLWWATMRAS